jgi:hypothetical protein
MVTPNKRLATAPTRSPDHAGVHASDALKFVRYHNTPDPRPCSADHIHKRSLAWRRLLAAIAKIAMYAKGGH